MGLGKSQWTWWWWGNAWGQQSYDDNFLSIRDVKSLPGIKRVVVIFVLAVLQDFFCIWKYKFKSYELFTFGEFLGIWIQVSFSFHNTPILTSRNSHTKIHWAATIHVFNMEDHTYCTWWSQAGSSNQITMQTIGWGSQSICNKISEAYRSNIRACKAWQNLHKLCRRGYGVSFDKIVM